MSHNNFPSTRKREATVQLSDTFSEGWAPAGAPPVADFDSLLTAQVRNTGRFTDIQSPIGAWPSTGNYGAVLLAQLRQEQQRLYSVYEKLERTDLPDAQALRASLDGEVIANINWMPRNKKHHELGQNGDDFYLAEIGSKKEDGEFELLNLQITAPLAFFSGVASRGLISNLWRVRDDNPIWPKGEQFRSSVVTQLRNFREGLDWVPTSSVPGIGKQAIELAWGDKYGNGRLEKPASIVLPELPGQDLCLKIDGTKELRVNGVSRLTEIPEDELGAYINPADPQTPCLPHYIELARRVSNPNDPRNSAYETLRRAAAPEGSNQHPDWSQVEIEIAA